MKQIFTLSLAILLMAGNLRAQSLPNGGFENWTTLAPMIENPTDWFTFNFLAIFGAPITSVKSTDKRSGDYSLQLKAVDDDGEVFPGVALTSFASNKKPTRLTGWYKYTRTNNADSAIVTILATKFNSVTQQSDPVGGGTALLGPATQWTSFNAVVEYVATDNPDSVSVILSPTIGDDNNDGFIADAWFDDLNVEFGGTGLADVLPVVGKAKLFPNPAQGATTLEFFSHYEVSFNVMLIESTGKIHRLAHNVSFGAGDSKLDLNLNGVSPGVHFIQISNGERSQMMKITVL